MGKKHMSQEYSLPPLLPQDHSPTTAEEGRAKQDRGGAGSRGQLILADKGKGGVPWLSGWDSCSQKANYIDVCSYTIQYKLQAHTPLGPPVLTKPRVY